ncbi:MAG: hypothetical protein QW366_01000 [Sulfolobales archaeon]
MSYISRYTIIPEEVASQQNIANLLINSSKANTTQLINAVNSQETSFGGLPPEISYILVMTIILAVTILLLIMISPSLSRNIERPLISSASADARGEGEGSIYRYEGVRLVLREIYLRLRILLRCSICTPRELSGSSFKTDLDLKTFSYLYEEIVYGGREPIDEEYKKIESLRKCLENSR